MCRAQRHCPAYAGVPRDHDWIPEVHQASGLHLHVHLGLPSPAGAALNSPSAAYTHCASPCVVVDIRVTAWHRGLMLAYDVCCLFMPLPCVCLSGGNGSRPRPLCWCTPQTSAYRVARTPCCCSHVLPLHMLLHFFLHVLSSGCLCVGQMGRQVGSRSSTIASACGFVHCNSC